MSAYFELVEAAERMRVSDQVLLRDIKLGTLRAKRSAKNAKGEPAGKYLIRDVDLDKWFDRLPDA